MTDTVPRTTAVLFDVGGVLVTNRPDPTRVAQLLGLDASAESVSLVDHSTWFHRDAYDAGCSDREFWDRVAGDCGLGEISDETLCALVHEDVFRSEEPDAGALGIARELQRDGLRLGILSNAPVAIARAIEQRPWAAGLFESFTFSGPLGETKPERAIYRRAVEDIGVPAEEILFIDDRSPNLRAAQLMGMSTLQWTTVAAAHTQLAELLGRTGALAS
ncbi:MAG: HAD family hydrolase [Pauljensenia sp.]